MAKSITDLRPNNTNETENAPKTPGTAKTPENRLSKGQIYLEWEAPEYIVYKKTTVWYIGFGVFLALLLFSAFVMQSFLTGVIFFLSGVLIYFHSERPPKVISYDIRTTGIKIGTRVYLYRELAGFNIVERGTDIYLLLKSKRLLMPLIHLPLPENINHEEVIEVIANHLPQDTDFVEPLADVLAHWVGF